MLKLRSERQLSILRKCLNLASSLPVERGKQRIACLITDKRGKVLSVGYNSYESSCRMQRTFANKVGKPDAAFNHAEISALSKLKHFHKPHTLYVARANALGNPLYCEPCIVCKSAIEHLGIKEVIFSYEKPSSKE